MNLCPLITRRDHIKLLGAKLKESLELIGKLQKAIEEKHVTFDAECRKLQHEVTPWQSVLFILWTTRNAEKLSKVTFACTL